MEFRKHINLEKSLYILALITGIIFRMVHLGQTNLSDGEALLSLQSLALSQGEAVPLFPYSFYIVWTGFLFFLFDATPFLARLLPVLAGCSLIFLPYLFRSRLGRWPGVVLAFAFALDPGLVAVSKIAGADMLAMVFLYFAIAYFMLDRPGISGIFFAGALMAGSQVWHGILVMGMAIAWTALVGRDKGIFGPAGERYRLTEHIRTFAWRKWSVFMVITLLLGGTLFMTVPTGIGGFISALVSYIKGWTNPQPVDWSELGASLMIYELFPLIFGIWAAFRSFIWGDDFDKFVARWFLISILYLALYPSHQVVDLIWVILPGLILSCRLLVTFLPIESDNLRIVSGEAVAIFILFIFCHLMLLGLFNTNPAESIFQIRLIGLSGGIVLLLLVLFFVSWGWSFSISGKGLFWSVVSILFVFTLGQTLKAGRLTRNVTSEMWNPGAAIPDAQNLRKTIGDFSEWNTGLREEIDITVLQEAAIPALQWELRNFEHIRYMEYLPVGSNPSMVISSEAYDIAQSKNYSGQNFVIKESPDWRNFGIKDWYYWAMLRKGSTQKEYAVLWLRSDLFPASEFEETESIQ